MLFSLPSLVRVSEIKYVSQLIFKKQQLFIKRTVLIPFAPNFGPK